MALLGIMRTHNGLDYYEQGICFHGETAYLVALDQQVIWLHFPTMDVDDEDEGVLLNALEAMATERYRDES